MFKVGDRVKVISDRANYRHCLGKIGTIVSDEGNNCFVLTFDFVLPPQTDNIRRNGEARLFLDTELEPEPKESNIMRLLDKIDREG